MEERDNDKESADAVNLAAPAARRPWHRPVMDVVPIAVATALNSNHTSDNGNSLS
ncbi:MAG: hypothetical protein P4M00_01570 [Azospirillaceae bacterium]|nr:hypothetical protein [Azospirillaceae bacterium]